MRIYKLGVVIFLLVQSLNANNKLFEKNCSSCHFASQQLNMFIARYTLQYSSPKRIKKAIFDYLKNPKKQNSIMPRGFLNRFGVKEATTLDDSELQKSIDEYYDIYNLKKRIE